MRSRSLEAEHFPCLDALVTAACAQLGDVSPAPVRAGRGGPFPPGGPAPSASRPRSRTRSRSPSGWSPGAAARPEAVRLASIAPAPTP